MTPFAVNLKTAMESTPDLSRRGRKLLAFLDRRDSRRKTRVLARMERHAAAYLVPEEGLHIAMPDWSTWDWAKIIWGLLKILLALLPLLMKEEGME